LIIIITVGETKKENKKFDLERGRTSRF